MKETTVNGDLDPVRASYETWQRNRKLLTKIGQKLRTHRPPWLTPTEAREYAKRITAAEAAGSSSNRVHRLLVDWRCDQAIGETRADGDRIRRPMGRRERQRKLVEADLRLRQIAEDQQRDRLGLPTLAPAI